MTTLTTSDSLENIVTRVARLNAGDRARWGRMTAHQMICHLTDCFRFSFGERIVSPATGPLQRTLVKWIALYTPVPWPRGVKTRPEMDQCAGGTRPAEFERDRAELLAYTRRFASETPPARPAHPIFGQMSEFEWMRWAYLHMDHHLRQFGL